MFGAATLEYKLKPDDDWKLDFDDIESKMSDDVKLLVLINPNNPCGAVAGKDEIFRILSIARKWPNCIVIADEIYDGLDFTGEHRSVASLSPDVPVFVLNGVSKVYYAPGWRIGYLGIHDPKGRLVSIRDGIERLLRSRLCASTPAQMGYLAGLDGDRSWMKSYSDKIKRQRDLCVQRINSIEGLEVQSSGGAFYMFIKLTDEHWQQNDKDFVLKLLHEEHVLVVHGSGFSPDLGGGHFRLVYLPDVDILNEAFNRIERFLLRHRS